MPKLTTKKTNDYWVKIKRWHLGLEDYDGNWCEKPTYDELLEIIATAKATIITQGKDIETLNQAIIEIKKEFKKLKAKK